jgi:hypothetical protein
LRLCALHPTFPGRTLAPHPRNQGERQHYSSFQFCDHRYEVGDHAYLIPEDAAEPLFLARIVDAFEDLRAEGSERLCIEARSRALWAAAARGGGARDRRRGARARGAGGDLRPRAAAASAALGRGLSSALRPPSWLSLSLQGSGPSFP